MHDAQKNLLRIAHHFDEHALRGVEKFFDHLRDVLSSLLDPTSVSELREASLIGDADRKLLLYVHDALMLTRRQAERALLEGNDEEVILSIYSSFWETYGERVLRVYALLVEGWNKRGEDHARTDYVG